MSDVSQSQAKSRPVGVTILAILAGIAGVFAAIHSLQYFGIFPFVVGGSTAVGGTATVHYFNFWLALTYGLLFWVYIWLTMALWRVEAGAWMFLVILTFFFLSIDLFQMLGVSTFQDVSFSIILNGIILLYCMLPGVRTAFGTQS